MARSLRFILALAVGALALPNLHCNPANGFEDYDANPPPPPPDVTPPTFAGPRGATGVDDNTIQITWDAATDDQSPPAKITYLVFLATTADGIDFTKPALRTPSGATGAVVPGLLAATQYFVAVRAFDADNNVDANEVVLAVTTGDKTPPVFEGVQKVTGASATSLQVEWNAAKDEGSPTAGIRYAIFVSGTSGGQDFKATPALFTTAGATSGVIGGLAEATKYFVVVRAIDIAGNVATSTKELPGTTLDITPPTFAGVTSASATGTSIKLDWPAASDLVDTPADLTYAIYQGITAGGIDFTKPNYKVPGALTYTATGLDPATKYFFIVRARDKSLNEETNLVEVSATTAGSADTRPPTFGGLVSATAASKTSLNLAWAEAADDFSPAANIVYDVYFSTTAGGEPFTVATTKFVKGAAAYTLTGLTANTTYFIVVRAKDEGGNEDTNVIEKSAKTLP